MSSTVNNDFKEYPIIDDMNKLDNPWLPKLDIFEFFDISEIRNLDTRILNERRQFARNRLAQTDIGREDFLFMKPRDHLMNYLCTADAYLKLHKLKELLCGSINECKEYFNSCMTNDPEDKRLGYSLTQHRILFAVICIRHFQLLCCNHDYTEYVVHTYIDEYLLKFLCEQRIRF